MQRIAVVDMQGHTPRGAMADAMSSASGDRVPTSERTERALQAMADDAAADARSNPTLPTHTTRRHCRRATRRRADAATRRHAADAHPTSAPDGGSDAPSDGSAATGQPGVLQPDAPSDGSAATGQPGVLQPDAPSDGSAATGQPGVLQPDAPSDGSAATGQPGVLQPDAPSDGSAATGQPGVLQPDAPPEHAHPRRVQQLGNQECCPRHSATASAGRQQRTQRAVGAACSGLVVVVKLAILCFSL